ncbi:uncharacterized protein LOC131957827 isoform X2 [Physella acuta]|uniref:uncharacterized protein LOC131957827 isoform X2 n=1 Tax=Physella acuta TaxID=109671 RepID=UPI0027DB124C|nr:uncharacterized protein LOC131957827 isoform X2 [Physella acuta]
MEDEDDVVYQGDIFKLSETRKRIIGKKEGSWKQRYLIFRIKGEKPVLEYHKKKPKNNKKPERTITESFELWPSYKVEKLKNARGRTFVCEITSPDNHIFLSANAEKDIDVLVFLLQVQIRLKDNIRNLINVTPEDTECLYKIGARDAKCVLHASPWGLTLALERTRAILAQWPLKSIRYYEIPEPGHFNIEAGRVAPMGEGLFQFKTRRGDEDIMYDLVDSYIVNTLDRVKPTQKGTPEEIEDYMREHECLHSLTTLIVCSAKEPEIRNILKNNWGIGSLAPEEQETVNRSASRTNSSELQPVSRPTQSSSLVINLERPGESTTDSTASRNESASSRRLSEEARITDRPPPLPSRSNNNGAPRRSRRREQSVPRKVDVEGGSVSSESPRLQFSTHPRSKQEDEARSSLSSDTGVNLQPHHTEFYHLSSPNMKVRVSKSPIITKNPNKVGRAEYLLSLQQSGVKSPTSGGSNHPSTDGWDFQVGRNKKSFSIDAPKEVVEAHRGSDSSWATLRRDISTSDHSINSSVSKLSISNLPQDGYINLQGSSSGLAVQHSRQRSAPVEMITEPAAHTFRSVSKESSDLTLSPPTVRHVRHHSADDLDCSSFQSIDPAQNGYIGARTGNGSSDSGYRNLQDDEPLGNKQLADRQISGISGLDSVDGTVNEWLLSASCEDLSDHMRTVIYDKDIQLEDQEDRGLKERLKKCEKFLMKEDWNSTLSSAESTSSSDKPPLPFTGLKKFQDGTEANGYRDRSKSFGYMNIANTATSGPAKPQSNAPSAHLIRKMVNARAKQETLRKSLSNPNFLNLGSKEHLFTLKSSCPNSSGSSTKLNSQHKQKSKSFSSLFPALKKAFSRESLGHSRSTTPERRNSRSATPERRSSFSFRRRSSDSESNLRRQNSFHSIGEMTIKGIRMTERSRSFRRVRGSKSVEILSKEKDNVEDENRISCLTTVSSPPEVSQPTDNRTSAASIKINSFSITATNPNYVTTAQIDLTPATNDQPPPIPARLKIEDVTDLSQPVKLLKPTPSRESEPGYLNTPGHELLNKPVAPASSSAVFSSHVSGYQNFHTNSSAPSSDEYQNVPDSSNPSKRPVVSDMVAKLEVSSTDPKLLHGQSPSAQHRDLGGGSPSLSRQTRAGYSNIGQGSSPGVHQHGGAAVKGLTRPNVITGGQKVVSETEGVHNSVTSQGSDNRRTSSGGQGSDGRVSSSGPVSYRRVGSTSQGSDRRVSSSSQGSDKRISSSTQGSGKREGSTSQGSDRKDSSSTQGSDRRISSSTQGSGKREGSTSQGSDNRVSSNSLGSDKRGSSSSQWGSDKRVSSVSQGSDKRTSQGSGERKSSTGSRGSPVKYVKPAKSSTGDSSPKDTVVTSTKPPVSSIPKPFQPIPFKRQEQNGFRPVQAPKAIKKTES